MGALSGAPGASGLLGPAGVFAVLALGALDLGLEQSIVLPALPVIGVEEQATPDAVTWLVTGYCSPRRSPYRSSRDWATCSGGGAWWSPHWPPSPRAR